MKKKLLLLIASLFLNPAFAAATPDVSAEEAPLFIAKDTIVLTHKQHEENKELNYTVQVKYPQIKASKLSAGAAEFNAAITKIVKEETDQFKKNIALDSAHMKTLPEALRKNSFTMDYDIDVIKPKANSIISVRVSVEGMQAGRAHPYHAKRVVNFDLNKQKVLTLNDLFKPNSPYLKAIAAYATKALNEKLKHDNWMVAKGTTPSVENFKNWNLQGDSLLITFDEYQVAPYVYGNQEVEIPYAELKKIFSEKAPIADCVDAGCQGIG